VRLHFIVEGYAEEGFVNRVLRPEFASYEIFVDARRVLTGRQGVKKFRGGLKNYDKLRNDIVLWMKEDNGPDSWFTSMVDFYGLPTNFPEYLECSNKPTALDRVKCLEVNLENDIRNKISNDQATLRFVPHIQLHEFETLLFSDISSFSRRFPGSQGEADRLREMVAEAGEPEAINGGETTHPSERICQTINRYDKRSDGIELATIIGLIAMREQCPHFNAWIATLLQLK
jgi:Domain of unknown function (DUF4276)